jgi:hypothetical protein
MKTSTPSTSKDDGAEEYAAMVPVLIAVLDTQSGKALSVAE